MLGWSYIIDSFLQAKYNREKNFKPEAEFNNKLPC